MNSKPLLLASSSPYRAEILGAAGFAFTTASPDVDETLPADLKAQPAVEMLAQKKARAVQALYPRHVILAADTLVQSVDGAVLAKPVDRAEAARWLEQRSGSSEQVISGVCVLYEDQCEVFSSLSHVFYHPIDAITQQALLDSEQWRGVCGGLKIEGDIARFVRHIEGDLNTIRGLPMTQAAAILNCFGVYPQTA